MIVPSITGIAGRACKQVWACCKAAWATDALCVEQDVRLIYRQMGPLREGLEGIDHVGPRPAAAIEGLLHEWT